jgi:hypothetical protein
MDSPEREAVVTMLGLFMHLLAEHWGEITAGSEGPPASPP